MIRFGVWSPSRAIWEQSWITAGIFEPQLDEDGQPTGRLQFSEPYRGQIQHNADSWPGIITKVDGVYEDGVEITPPVLVPGWHTNVIVYGESLLAQFTAGLPQTDEEGTLLPVWQRTHAAAVFQLTYQPADAETGFPEGYRSAEGVVYADAGAFSSPANVF